MKAQKQLPILLATCLAGLNLAAHAGASSVLDPYFMVPAPKNAEEALEARNPKLKKQKQKQRKMAAKAPKENLFSAEKPVSDVKFEDEKPKKEVLFNGPAAGKAAEDTTKPVAAPPTKVHAPLPVEHKAQAPSKAKSMIAADRPTIWNGTKQIGSGIAEASKATGIDIVTGTKVVSHGVAVGSQKTYEGMKWTGQKIASGTVATKEKLSQAHQDGFKQSMVAAGASVKSMTIACGTKIWDGTKWVGHECGIGALKTLDGASWLAQKTGDGAEAAKDKLSSRFGSGISNDPALAATPDPAKVIK